jgi:hypothetical protein
MVEHFEPYRMAAALIGLSLKTIFGLGTADE